MANIKARTPFKSSFLSEIAMITRDQVCLEDVCTIANVTCEDFSIDDLLDFSHNDFVEASFQESEEDENKDSVSESSNQQLSFNHNSTDNDVVFGDLPVGELSVPVHEVENLEWLSQIEDDFLAEVSLSCPVGNFNWNTGNFHVNRGEPVGKPVVQRVKEPCFPLPVCRKPRAKRPRPDGNMISPYLFFDCFSSVKKTVVKKQKKKHEGENGSAQTVLRRCSHCQVQKTPQWRAGPLGPKTLCNACGVRYKSGRLFPEYRPACSPTFSQEAHSNSHRKVLEMRQQKEVVGGLETGLSLIVKSF